MEKYSYDIRVRSCPNLGKYKDSRLFIIFNYLQSEWAAQLSFTLLFGNLIP